MKTPWILSLKRMRVQRQRLRCCNVVAFLMATLRLHKKRRPVKRKRKQKRTSKKTKKAKISNKETKECEESDWDTEVWVSSDSDSTMCVPHSLPSIGDSDTDPDIRKLERQDGNAAWYFNKPGA